MRSVRGGGSGTGYKKTVRNVATCEKTQNQFPAHERPPLAESGSAVQKDKPKVCPQKKSSEQDCE